MQRVKTLRQNLGLSQDELAEKAGLSLRTIQRIEKGETEPHGDTLKKLADALEVSPEDLFMEEDKQYLRFLNYSTLAFLVQPFLGVIIPLLLWTYKKDKIKGVDTLGKKIIHFQIFWLIAFYVTKFIIAWISTPILANSANGLRPSSFSTTQEFTDYYHSHLWNHSFLTTFLLYLPYVVYLFNLIFILNNRKRIDNDEFFK